MSTTNQQAVKVGIIGAGAAGLTLAWLLDKDYEVTLFEKRDYVGGHAHSLDIACQGESIPIDLGFEFFNEVTYPHLSRLLKLLNVGVNSYPLTYSFYRTDRTNIPDLTCNRAWWHVLIPSNLSRLIQFNYFLCKGKKSLNTGDKHLVFEEFVEDLHLTKKFKNDFLYPFLSSWWGASCSDLKKFAAYNVLAWSVKNRPSGIFVPTWDEIIGGASVYIKALVQSLWNTKIKLSSHIVSITREQNTYVIKEEDGTLSSYEYLIIATDAKEAHDLLKNVSEAGNFRSILSNIKYYPTAIAIHGDSRLMPTNKANWSVVNIRYDGVQSEITVYKPWKNPTSTPLFRSWITGDLEYSPPRLPDPIYALAYYYHAYLTPAYFKAQEDLAAIQGAHNLWLAGLYMHDIDSHESAIVSAMRIAETLAPNSERLRQLKHLC